jgi:TIR domain
MTQIFVSYSHQDEHYLGKGELIDFLKKGLGRKAKFWYDEAIITGEPWNEAIHENILNSQIAILLISDNFIKSKYIKQTEIRKFFTATIKKFVVFPVIISPCNPQKIKWLREIPDKQYIPRNNQSIEQDFPKGKSRRDLYKEILAHLEDRIKYVRNPEITAGQAFAALINLINTIESELLIVCNRKDLINNNHSLMFEGRSDELYARKKDRITGTEKLTIVKFEELKETLLPKDFKKIMQLDKKLSSKYSKWFSLDTRRFKTIKEKRSIDLLKYKIILEMFSELIGMLDYFHKIQFDLDDHYNSIYNAMKVIGQTKAMNSR